MFDSVIIYDNISLIMGWKDDYFLVEAVNCLASNVEERYFKIMSLDNKFYLGINFMLFRKMAACPRCHCISMFMSN